jgi:peptide/nickel transport system permease protein
MTLSDPETTLRADAAVTAPVAGRRRARARTRRAEALVGTAQLVAGLMFTALGMKTLHHDAMWIRVLLVLVGITVGYRGIRNTARAVAGSEVDVAFGLSIGWLALLAVAALLAPVLPLGEHVDTAKTITVTGYLRPDLFSSHPFGTNQLGLDILARVIWGARLSLTAALLAMLVGTVVGGLIGILAGYFSGVLDRGIGVLTNVALAFPPLVLLLVLASVAGRTFFSIVFALSLLVVPGTIRFARANALAYAQRQHTFVARILGGTRLQVLRREVLPSVAVMLTSMAFLTLPLLIVAEASLGYIGLGIRPPEPTWGNMIAEGGNGVFESNPHVVLIPGAVLFLTVFALNVIGQRLRHRWDPRHAQL